MADAPPPPKQGTPSAHGDTGRRPVEDQADDYDYDDEQYEGRYEGEGYDDGEGYYDDGEGAGYADYADNGDDDAPSVMKGMKSGFEMYAAQPGRTMGDIYGTPGAAEEYSPSNKPTRQQAATAQSRQTPPTEPYQRARGSAQRAPSEEYYDDDEYYDNAPNAASGGQEYELEGRVYARKGSQTARPPPPASPAQAPQQHSPAPAPSPQQTAAAAPSPLQQQQQQQAPTPAGAPHAAAASPVPGGSAGPSTRPRSRGTQARNPRFQGDVSMWGRDEYDYDELSEGASSLSSGISPRRRRDRAPMDIEAAKRTLAYSAGMYGHAAAMRGRGDATANVLTITDDLPNRLAYVQLQALEGMASKVQRAIEKNKKFYEARVKAKEQQLLKNAFDAWKLAKYGSLREQQLLRRAVARIARGTLARAFYAWRDRFHLVDQNWRMRRKVQATIERGLLRRTFAEWRRLCEARRWEIEFDMRETRVKELQRQLDRYQKRPIYVMRNRHMRNMLMAWFNLSSERRNRRQRFEKAARYWANQQLAKAWQGWQYFMYRRNLFRKACKKVANAKLLAAWNSWREAIYERQRREMRFEKAARAWSNNTMAKAWRSWTDYLAWRREKKQIINRWKQPMLAKAFAGWVEHAAWSQRMKMVLKRMENKLVRRTLSNAFDGWRAAVEEVKWERMHTTKEDLVVEIGELKAENERLRRDNERFVRLIDSGEWGRGRVAELVGAGEVLKGERDALLKLIQSLRREYEAVERAKSAQEDELRSLKERMMLGGAARNRMLIKGGSSFNALVRAMKQDLVDGGSGGGAPAAGRPAGRDPNLLYEIDKLSMDHVNVFPDGELNVQAVATVNNTAAFAQSVNAGRSKSPGPVQPIRMPGSLAQMGLPDPRARLASPGPSGPLRPSSAPQTAEARTLQAIQSLSPADVDRLEAAVRAAGAGVAPRPQGMSSTTPVRR